VVSTNGEFNLDSIPVFNIHWNSFRRLPHLEAFLNSRFQGSGLEETFSGAITVMQRDPSAHITFRRLFWNNVHHAKRWIHAWGSLIANVFVIRDYISKVDLLSWGTCDILKPRRTRVDDQRFMGAISKPLRLYVLPNSHPDVAECSRSGESQENDFQLSNWRSLSPTSL